jgi:hypothetical protein
MSFNEDDHLAPNLTRDQLDKFMAAFLEEDEYDSKMFFKDLRGRKAMMRLPFDSLLDLVKVSVCYDIEKNFDGRLLTQLIHKDDLKLYAWVFEAAAQRFLNNPEKPAGPLTLAQFKAVLARRLAQAGF